MSNKLHGKVASAPQPAATTPDPDEIVDLLSVDCHVSVFYTSTGVLIRDIMEPALRLMLSRSGGIPPVGSVITLMMSVERAADDGPQIIMPGGNA